ncbi:hypothetical protein BH79_00740 [Pseudomonas aeruginosa C0324C]|uniref:Uncharacterized protein n=1 Tax=Stenotrophomonas maltophilia TaxID=40324 RepID=A0AB34TGT2_STEMA|nr:hypothetical protein BH78_18275 [Pseudomonas aeruginosa C1913C]KEA32106.1 hypothetical protein BH79_00740 [Pseudomonas aeruginosa C0324C]KOO82211.1 hypothetical protein VL23_02625 [Stenotrophomonas maltophilia]RIZ20488.1 hypothetical protein AXW99_03130 [Pseudomonas aeruginosa]
MALSHIDTGCTCQDCAFAQSVQKQPALLPRALGVCFIFCRQMCQQTLLSVDTDCAAVIVIRCPLGMAVDHVQKLQRSINTACRPGSAVGHMNRVA